MSKKRINEINNIVDSLQPNDNINIIINKYKSELEGYEYIDTVEKFSLLSLRGNIRYVNKYDKEIRYGGLLLKIYEKNDKWKAVLKQINNKKYYICFNNNYIFYHNKKKKPLDNWLDCFVNDLEKGIYDIE